MGRQGLSWMVAALLSSGAVMAQTQAPVSQKPGTAPVTPRDQAAAKNLMEDVTVTGCVRLWQPQPEDPARMPADRQPGLAGVYLLTPLSSSPNASTDIPTYVLTPSATIIYSQHVGKEVTVSGTAQTAPLPPTVQEIATAPTMRPENKPTTNGMPRLTASSVKVVKDSCP